MNVEGVGLECGSTAFRLPLPGYLNGSVYDRGAYGVWWSATRSDAPRMYTLYATTTGIYPSNYNDRNHGYTLRCVLGS